MKKLFPVIIALILFLLPVSIVLAVDISQATYTATIRITNNSTTTTNVAVPFTADTDVYIDGGYMNSSANNTAVLSSSGADVRYMPAISGNTTWSVFVPSIGSNTIKNDTLYMGGATDMGGFIRYFPADGGMAVSDAASLELSDNFSVEISGYFDLSSTIVIDEYLDFTRTNSDWVSVPDDDGFSFVTGGVDEPFSITAWIYFEDATDSTIIAKSKAAAYEWYFKTAGGDILDFSVVKVDGSAHQGRTTDATTAFEDQWTHLCATYDGSEAAAGINIYLNAVDSDTGDTTGGAYAGMTAGNTLVSIGANLEGTASYLDGGIAQLKVYSVELTPSQVLDDLAGVHKTSDLVAYYKFDEGTGNPQDSSGNGHHATANLADWATGADIIQSSQIFIKSGAISGSIGGSSNITSSISGGASVTLDGISTGEHTYKVSANTTHLASVIDEGLAGEVSGSAALGGVPVPDNAIDWRFFANGSMTYIDTANITVDGVLAGSWTWENSAIFTDASVNGNDATPTFRTISSDADVSAVLVDFAPVSEAKAPAYAIDIPTTGWITENITTTGNYTSNVTASTYPGSAVITDIATAGETPVSVLTLILGCGIILAFSLFISWIMKANQERSLMIKLITVAAGVGIMIAVAAFDQWLLYMFLMIGIAIVMASSSRTFSGTGNTGNNMLGFLSMSFVGMTMINRILEGRFLQTTDIAIVREVVAFQPFNVFGLFTIPVPNVSFLTNGIPALMRWDYSFFGGNSQIIQYLLYSVTAVVSFMLFVLVFGVIYQMFSRGR